MGDPSGDTGGDNGADRGLDKGVDYGVDKGVDISVDVESLRALSGRLRAGADQLQAVLDELAAETPGRLGTPALDDACERFHRDWRYGMSLIRRNVDRAGAGLDTTADVYQQHELDAARLFGSLLRPGRVSAPASTRPSIPPPTPDPTLDPTSDPAVVEERAAP